MSEQRRLEGIVVTYRNGRPADGVALLLDDGSKVALSNVVEVAERISNSPRSETTLTFVGVIVSKLQVDAPESPS